MNAASSRSHTIFTLEVEREEGEEDDDERRDSERRRYRTCRFTAADLAGMERSDKSTAGGARVRERYGLRDGAGRDGAEGPRRGGANQRPRPPPTPLFWP